jgi:hypothetical protein
MTSTENHTMDLRRVRTDRSTGKLREMTDDELIEHALSWAADMLLARDEMNAAVHTTHVRLSPITQIVTDARDIARSRLAKL